MGCMIGRDGEVCLPNSQLNPKVDAKGSQIVMGRFKMFMGSNDIMGEGTSSICRRGVEIATGIEVAIKIYKEQKGGTSGKVKTVTMQKFKRQIAVLQELQQPFKQTSDPKLWHSRLDTVSPERIFMKLLDYSKEKGSNEPAPDPSDGFLYVITELAQYSLKDFISNLREKKKPLSQDTARNISKSIVLAMAGLHAKGYVHLDMKPENMMMFNGRLKVIDVDGCVKIGTKVSIQDSSISFSPCYCAPEWARFLISETETTILAEASLDVWSVGMTLCELVTHDAVLKPQYGNFLRNASSHREAGFLFMEWLGGVKKPPLPSKIEAFDKDLADLIRSWLLICKKDNRRSCAESLSHPYIKAANWTEEDHAGDIAEDAPRIVRDPRVEAPRGTPLFKGVLFKLNTNGDAKKAEDWIRRDMWVAQNHSLCYYSVKEDKKLVLIDGSKLSRAHFEVLQNAARPFAFQVQASEDEAQFFSLAAESKEDMDAWLSKLKKSGRMDMLITFQLGAPLAKDLQAFKLNVKNRRMKVKADSEFEPDFKAKLWKLKGDGDSMREEDWFERDMWIAKNGSLVYFSPKENSELVYYTAADISRATIVPLEEGKACKPFAFQVQLPQGQDGVEFSPGEFAAESEELRTSWMDEFRKHSAA